MKQDQQEYIYTLLLRKQIGQLNEVEKKQLEKAMEQNENVRNCYFEQEEARRYTFNAILEDLHVEHEWCKVEALCKPRPLHTRIIQFLGAHHKVAAAVLVSGLAFAGLYFIRPSQQPSFVVVHRVPHAASYHFPKQTFPAIVTGNAVQTDTATPALLAMNTILPDTVTRFVQGVKHIEGDTIYQSNTIEWNTLTVPPQTDYHIELSDGTEVHLNASSTLRFPFIFPGKTREVYLEGEAYFTVTHNPSQPFIVHTGTASVIALGTAFNVNSYDNSMITTSLVQGTVITDVGDSLDVTLKPGYEAVYRPGGAFKVKRFDETVTLGWRDGVFRFMNKPLEDIGPVLMRWFGMKLDFATPALAQRIFSGDLEKDKPLSGFLNDICKRLDLDYKMYDGTVHFIALHKPQM